MNKTLSGATIPSLSGPGSGGNEGVLRIPQSSSITGISPSDCLVPYPGHSLWVGGSYFSAEMQLGKPTGQFLAWWIKVPDWNCRLKVSIHFNGQKWKTCQLRFTSKNSNYVGIDFCKNEDKKRKNSGSEFSRD